MKEKFESVKQENKRLLEIINAKPLETVDIDSAFEIEKLKEQLQAKEQECEELKQTLAEIKEIAEPFCETCQKFEPEKKDRNNIYCRFCNYGKILQKISECEVENAR